MTIITKKNCQCTFKHCNNRDVKLIQLKSSHSQKKTGAGAVFINEYNGEIKLACCECRKDIQGQFKLVHDVQ